MILEEPLMGARIRLRTAEPDDAEFVLSLRLDPERSKFLKSIDPSVENQRLWIIAKKAAPDDYHMIVEDAAGNTRHGVVAVYSITETSCVWGRWIIRSDAPVYVAWDSMLLVYDFAFRELGLKRTLFFVRKEHIGVVNFHRTYNVTPVESDDTYLYFQYSNDQFLADKSVQRQLSRAKRPVGEV